MLIKKKQFSLSNATFKITELQICSTNILRSQSETSRGRTKTNDQGKYTAT